MERVYCQRVEQNKCLLVLKNRRSASSVKDDDCLTFTDTAIVKWSITKHLRRHARSTSPTSRSAPLAIELTH